MTEETTPDAGKTPAELIDEIRASVLLATIATDLRIATRATEARIAAMPAPKGSVN